MKTVISIVLLFIGATFIIPKITTVSTVDKMTRGLEYVYMEPESVSMRKQRIDSLKMEIATALQEVKILKLNTIDDETVR